MRLYYLTSEHWAKVILKERRIKLSTVNELNDPFELLGASIGDKPARRIVQYVNKRLGEKFGMVCMSKTWQSPVMWAHYGDKHRGVCLGFDVADDAPKEVQYTPERLTHLLGERPRLSDIDRDALVDLITTKFQDWSYEREWRVFDSLRGDNQDPTSKLHFLSFHDEVFSLREVILGHRCPWTVQAAARTVGKVKKVVSIKKVRPSFQRFEMVRQQRMPIFQMRPE